MVKKKTKKGEFKISVRYSSMPEEEKRKLLWQCFDIFLSNRAKKKQNRDK